MDELIKAIREVVCEEFNMTEDQLIGDSRLRSYTEARMAAVCAGQAVRPGVRNEFLGSVIGRERTSHYYTDRQWEYLRGRDTGLRLIAEKVLNRVQSKFAYCQNCMHYEGGSCKVLGVKVYKEFWCKEFKEQEKKEWIQRALINM